MHDAGMLLDLYGCASQPQAWPRMLDRLCADTQAQSAVLQAFALDHDGVRVLWQSTDTRTARRSTDMTRLGSTDNPRIDRARMLRAVNRVVRDDDIFGLSDEPARTALQDQLAWARLGGFMGILRVQSEGLLLGIALHRAADDPRDFDRTSADRLEALAPHFGQAWELGHQLWTAESQTQRMRAHIDALQFGVLVCDGHGRVQWMNLSARSLIEQARCLTLRGGELHALRPAQSTRLRDEIAAVARSSDGATRYVAVEGSGGTLHLALRSQPDDGQGAVIVAITSPRAVVRVPADAWCRLLGVTAAEASLVAALVQGRTLEEHAVRRGISIGTARNQLKQALAKTGTSRQVDLVRLALSSAAAQVLDGIPQRSDGCQKDQAARIAICVP